jgi:electron transfer flavoprotein beta subunit
MKIIVGLKHVPDTEARIKIGSDGVTVDETGIKTIISPFDEYALEEALRLREQRGGEVIVVCAGKEAAQVSLRQGLAMGADRAVHVVDDRFDRADALARARALAGVCRREAPDLVLLGKLGVGTDEGQTGPMLGELLDLPHVTAITKLEIGDGRFTAHREIEGGVEVVEGTLPAVLTCDKGLNEPRYPSLKGIMAAKKKPLESMKPDQVGVDPAELGEQARVVWESMELPPSRKAGTILPGEPEAAVRELVQRLRGEAKVI